jgi:hypothetical protein
VQPLRMARRIIYNGRWRAPRRSVPSFRGHRLTKAPTARCRISMPESTR